MKTLAVLIPVLGRPQNVVPLVRSLELSTVHERADGWTVTPLFLCSQGDAEQIAAVKKSGAEMLLVGSARDRSQYARKINAGAAATDTDWLFLGADDLDFHPCWLRTAVSLHVETGKLVLGTNDLGNPSVKAGRHATHSLVHRDYVNLGTIDQPGKVLHEGYDHNSCDVEFIETSKARDQFAFAADSHVQHLHPLWDRRVRRDTTYHKGMSNATRDRQLYYTRRRLWGNTESRPILPLVRTAGMAHARRRQMARWPKK